MCASHGTAAKRIIEWGRDHSVDFPWRSPDSAYASAIAEILLIRTPPEQVLPVYEHFMTAYPTVPDLADADRRAIAAIIEPLGLRWRAERLRSMAQYVTTELGGKFPESIQALTQIPGIGQYGASAIVIFHYRKRAVLVDANSVRFIKRYFGRSFAGEARRNKQLMAMMDELTPKQDGPAVEFAQGFLDFMREVCSPNNPTCKDCILTISCEYSCET